MFFFWNDTETHGPGPDSKRRLHAHAEEFFARNSLPVITLLSCLEQPQVLKDFDMTPALDDDEDDEAEQVMERPTLLALPHQPQVERRSLVATLMLPLTLSSIRVC